MNELVFYRTRSPLTLSALAARLGTNLPADAEADVLVQGATTLDRAGPSDVTCFLEGDDVAALESTRALACLVSARHLALVPEHTIALAAEDPSAAFGAIVALLHPESSRPSSVIGRQGVDRAAHIHKDALIEDDVTIDPGVVVGPRAEIGAGTVIGANSTIGSDVRIGRGCAIDAQVSISHALIGDRVIIHAGGRIGHCAASAPARGVPQSLGRVIIQNDVVIGANAAVERGVRYDTVIGEGSHVESMVVVVFDQTIGRNARVCRR